MSRLKYFIVCTLLCLAFLFGNFLLEGWERTITYIANYYYAHLPYFIGAILFLFCSKRNRMLYLLFLITATDIQLICLTNGLLMYEIEGLKPFLFITSIASITIAGYSYCKEFASRKSILLTVFFGIVSCFVVSFASRWNWDIFITCFSSSFSELLNTFVGFFIGASFCFMKRTKTILKVGILFSILCIISSLYLKQSVYNWLCYGSFSGKAQQKIALSFYNEKKEHFNLSHLKKQYQVFFFWEYSKKNKDLELLDFERLSWSESQNKNLCFYVIASDTENVESPFPIYKNMGIQLPLIIDKNPQKTQKQLHAYSDILYVCVFKKDTLIYKNNIEETTKFIRHLNQKQ